MDPLYYQRSIALAGGAASLGPLFDPPPASEATARPVPRPRPRTPAPVVPAHRASVATSRQWAAHQAPKFGSKADRILTTVRARGVHGATRKELSGALGAAFPINVVCAAVDSLRKRGLVAQLETQRGGGFVLVAKEHAP